MYYIKGVVIFLFIGLTFFSCLNSCVAENTNATSLIIDDTNYDSYFNSDGHLIANIFQGNTIYLGNLSNKEIILDSPLEITSYNESSILNNCSIKISEDAYGSHIFNLKFFNVIDNDNSKFFAPIYINQSYNNLIENNIIVMDFYESSYYNIAGIFGIGECLNNNISFNRISINSKSGNGKHYVYGIEFTVTYSGATQFANYNPQNNIISGNIIDINSDYYSSGIYLSCAKDILISNNEIYLSSPSLSYGVVSEYFITGGSHILPSSNITISRNTIIANSSMVYLIESFDVDNVTISSNILTGTGNGVYGIAGYSCTNHTINSNNVIINGSDISLVNSNFDAISTGHSGIYYMKQSDNILITDNAIYSYYTPGGDYAIRFDDSSIVEIAIFNNKLTSNLNSYYGNDAINTKGYVFNNTFYSYENITYVEYSIVDIYVTVTGNDIYGNGSDDNPFSSLSKALSYLKNIVLQNTNKSTQIKGIIHMGEGIFTGYGSNLRLYISDLIVDIVGTNYNKTIIDGELSNWFLDISQSANVNIKNINFVNGIHRQSNSGVINNKGTLSLENCILTNIKVSSTSAIVYNVGILKLKNNIMKLTSANGHYIYNTGKIDNLILNLFADSINEYDRTMEINSSNVKFIAYLHDDRGNPVSGGNVKFFIESKEFFVNVNVDKGLASLDVIISLMGNLKVSAIYSNSYTNIFVNIGYINSSVNVNDVVFYVSKAGNDDNDGSYNKPFASINKALSFLSSVVDHMTIYLSEGTFYDNLKEFSSPYGLSIVGVEGKTFIIKNWAFNSNSTLELKNLIFNKTTITNHWVNLTINNCYFYNAPISAIFSEYGNLYVLNSNFINNGEANYESISVTVWPWNMNDFNLGGAIHNNFGTLTVLNSNFVANEAVYGGAIYNNQSNLYVSGCNFTNNLAFAGFHSLSVSSLGGAIYQFQGTEVVVSDCLFLNNSASGYGGAFYSSGSSNPIIINGFSSDLEGEHSPQEIYFINSIFQGNIAPNGGGAVYIIKNLFTQYISCQFLDNVVYTYNFPNILGYFSGVNWIFASDLYRYNIYSHSNQLSLGGAIYDNNLLILGSSFKSNTYDSGGVLITPTVIYNSNQLNYLSKNSMGVHVSDLGHGGDLIYVSDSSLLTGEDSKFLGISGWVGTYEGPSINKHIEEYYKDQGSGSGFGNGTGSSGSGSGFGNGTGSGGSGSLSLGDILNILGSGITLGNDNGINIQDLLNSLNKGSNNNNQNSSDIIEVNGTTDITQDVLRGYVSTGGDAVSVGVSIGVLTGIADDSFVDSSKSGLSSDSSGRTSSSNQGSSSRVHEVIKDVNKDMNLDSNSIIVFIILASVVASLLIIGYYRNDDD